MPFLLTLTASARVKIQNAARLQEQRNSTSSACCLAERLGSTAKWASFSARSTIVFVYGRFVSGFTHLPPERAIFERYGLQQSLTAANRSRLGTYGCCNQIDCCGFERTCPPVCLLHLYKAHHNAPCAPCLRPAAASRPAQAIGLQQLQHNGPPNSPSNNFNCCIEISGKLKPAGRHLQG